MSARGGEPVSVIGMVMQSEALRALTKRLLASCFDESYGCETKELDLVLTYVAMLSTT